MEVSFIGGENRSTPRKTPPCRKPQVIWRWSELDRMEMDNNDDAQGIINDDPNGNNDMVWRRE